MAAITHSWWFRLLRILAVGYGCLAVFACSMADHMIFMPPRPSYSADAPALVTFPTSEGSTVAAFYFPAQTGKPTVLYSHGNAEDAGQSIPLYQAWQNIGWGVLAYDYPGYGRTPGDPSESGSEEAVQAAWDFLADAEGITPSNIVVVGRSVGSGPSVWLAKHETPAALALISPFTSTYAIYSPAQYILPANRFPNLKRVRKSDVPLLVIHGEADRIIPASHGRALHQISPATQKQFVGIPRAGHNDLFQIAGPDIIQAIEGFVDQVRAR